MKQITVTELKRMKVAEIRETMPFRVVADGDTVGVMQGFDPPAKEDIETKCPNCKFVYNVIKPDNKPDFFTVQRGG